MTGPGDLAGISALSSGHGRLAVHYGIGTWISCPRAFPERYDRSRRALTFAGAFSRRPGLNPSGRETRGLAATLSRIHEHTYGGCDFAAKLVILQLLGRMPSIWNCIAVLMSLDLFLLIGKSSVSEKTGGAAVESDMIRSAQPRLMRCNMGTVIPLPSQRAYHHDA